MKIKRIRTYLALGSLAVLLQPLGTLAQDNAEASRTTSQPTAERDGQHDFDPLLGSWKYHLKRRLHPLTGSTTWIELNGTGVCYKVWDGGAQLDTFEADGSTGHIEV